ncbi:MAG: hypothetical protein RLZZ584_2965 [Pseudomonadota bacterium]|jgi:glycosyltransferase involved in cell wall biosynthesis
MAGVDAARAADGSRPVRVLYSFPHRLGAERICSTAWYQVTGLAQAGASVTVMAHSVRRPLPAGPQQHATLARGRLSLPFRVLGPLRTLALHDRIVAHRLAALAGQVDIVHLWPQGALRTLQVARTLGLPTVLERPNAHTRYAYEVVQRECARLGVTLPAGHEHARNDRVLAREEAEYALATRLLCPSDFVARTFLERGFDAASLARHRYGYDEQVFRAAPRLPAGTQPFTVLFAGGCAPRKGLHHALEAWLRSGACRDGRLLVAGAFVPGYREHLAGQLGHPSVQVLGHRTDMAALMQRSDALILPSIEEGSALVTSEARGCGCVLLVSEAAGAVCRHMVEGLVHPVGDVVQLARHIDMLHGSPALLEALRQASLAGAAALTWRAAGEVLLDVYRQTIAAQARPPASAAAGGCLRGIAGPGTLRLDGLIHRTGAAAVVCHAGRS